MHVDRSYLHSVIPSHATLPVFGTAQRVGATEDSLNQDGRRQRRREAQGDESREGDEAGLVGAEAPRSKEHTLDITV